MYMPPDVWIRLCPTTPGTLPATVTEGLRSALVEFKKLPLHIVCADWRNWATAVDYPCSWSLAGSRGDSDSTFTIAGVTLNGRGIHRVFAGRDADNLEILTRAGSFLINCRIPVSGMSFGRSHDLNTISLFTDWAKIVAWPAEHRDKSAQFQRGAV